MKSPARIVLATARWFGLVLALPAHAQSFQPGNLVVLRLGDKTQMLVNSGNTLYLDQYTTGGSLINSLQIPDNGAGALILSGTAATEGGLTRSLDARILAVTAYHTNRGSALSGSLSSQNGATVPRAVGTIDAFGVFKLAQSSPTLYSGTNPRCVATDGTNNFWAAGGAGGTYYLNPPQPPVLIQGGIANTRYLRTRGGNAYFTTRFGTEGLYTFVGGGLPVTNAGTRIVLATGANSQPAGFDLNSGLTLAYVADQRPTAGGIQKWTNLAGVWGLAYTLGTGAASNAFGVTVDFSGAAPIVYATTTEAGLDRLIRIVDTGSNAAATILATAVVNQTFRGLDFAPDLRPIILTQPQSQVVVSGSDVEFAVTVSSAYPTAYQWQKDGTNLIGATAASWIQHNVSAADGGSYRVVATNQYGAVMSANAQLTVQAQQTPPRVTMQPASQTNSLGGTAIFSVTASGTPPLAYQWQHNGMELVGQTNPTLALANLSAASQGDYRVSVSNTVAVIESQVATLTVLVPGSSFIAYSSPGWVYSQSFDTLPNPGLNSVNANNPVSISGVDYGVSDPFDFGWPVISNGVDPTSGIGIGGIGLSNTMAGWYGLGATAAKLGASTGDQSTGGVISFGLTNAPRASTNRALGLLATSSTGGTAFGAKFINQTTDTLAQITLRFTGELWRQGPVAKLLTVA